MKNLNSLLILFVSIFFFTCNVEETSRYKTPNIILIYADELGRGLLGYEGQKIIKTPNIDKLAKKGVRFENAYGCHYCAPARASMLSGYHDCHEDKWQISRGGAYIDKSSEEGFDTDQIQYKINEQFATAPDDEIFMAQVFQKAIHKIH